MKHFLVGVALFLAASVSIPAQSAELRSPEYPVKSAQSVRAADMTEALALSELDRKSIRFVVKMHVASLSQQRADLFSLTLTDQTQHAFDTADQMLVFFSLRNIPILMAHRFRFEGLSLDGPVPVQHGYLIDKKGNAWRVSYGLQQLGDADWRIIFSVIEHAPGNMT